MISNRDGHVRVLPLHVANKIAAGEVVERPASVVKELVENAIDAGATRIAITVTQGGRKLVSVRDDGCGMSRDDAVLSLERQATSKIRDVSDIEQIDTLGFRGEAIPAIASVSRFTLTTRRADSDEGTQLQVNAGILAEVRTAGCPPGTLVEVRDLFCNVPARRKFLRAYATEENHVRQVLVVHALAHPALGFTLVSDGRTLFELAPATGLRDRLRDLFGEEFLDGVLTVRADPARDVRVSGCIERPNLACPSRRDQYVFVNGRPATSPSIAYALREAYPRRNGETRPAAVLFIELPPGQVDVNVHPTKREVRFRDNTAVKEALLSAIGDALSSPGGPERRGLESPPPAPPGSVPATAPATAPASTDLREPPLATPASASTPASAPPPAPEPVPMEFAIDPDSTRARPWRWFRFLAQSASGYLLIETDAGIVTVNPLAARERIAYERLLGNLRGPANGAQPATGASQALLIPDTVQLPPTDAARIRASLCTIAAMGFQLEEFGHDTFKIDAVPQLIGSLPPASVLATIASDLAESGSRRGGERWREELIARSIARSFAGASLALTEEGAVKLVEDLCSCSMPYICPRGKPVMIFTSNRELERKFAK